MSGISVLTPLAPLSPGVLISGGCHNRRYANQGTNSAFHPHPPRPAPQPRRPAPNPRRIESAAASGIRPQPARRRKNHGFTEFVTVVVQCGMDTQGKSQRQVVYERVVEEVGTGNARQQQLERERQQQRERERAAPPATGRRGRRPDGARPKSARPKGNGTRLQYRKDHLPLPAGLTDSYYRTRTGVVRLKFGKAARSPIIGTIATGRTTPPPPRRTSKAESRQRLRDWRARQTAAGRCSQCRSRAKPGRSMCDEHLKMRRKGE